MATNVIHLRISFSPNNDIACKIDFIFVPRLKAKELISFNRLKDSDTSFSIIFAISLKLGTSSFTNFISSMAFILNGSTFFADKITGLQK